MGQTEWWYDWPEYKPEKKSCYILEVDEDSTQAEIEAEYEYWWDQMVTYELDGVHRDAVRAMIKWMTRLLESWQ